MKGAGIDMRNIGLRCRRGFTLVTVLIIVMMSVTLIGSIIYVFSASAGSTRVDVARTDTYNLLQGGIERAKTYLRERMNAADTDVPLRWNYSDASFLPVIERLSDLLIKDSRDPARVIGIVIPEAEPRASELAADDRYWESVHVGGGDWKYSVRIYDARYGGAAISSGGSEDDTDALKASLPQMMSFKDIEAPDDDPNVYAPNEGSRAGDPGGIYLIRAVLSPDFSGPVRTIETIVVQAMDED